MKRIRYKKQADGSLISNVIVYPEGMVQVTIEPANFTATFRGHLTPFVLDAPSMQVLKSKVKRSLMDLGVSFETERRIRRDNEETAD